MNSGDLRTNTAVLTGQQRIADGVASVRNGLCRPIIRALAGTAGKRPNPICHVSEESVRSVSPNDEFLDDRVRQQLCGELGDTDLGGAGVSYVADFDLEALSLADRYHLAEAEPVACPGDGLSLRVPDLRLQHDVDDYLGHTPQRTSGTHLTDRADWAVLSQRNMTRPVGRPALAGGRP